MQTELISKITNEKKDKGTSINDVPRFLAFFDLPTYLSPIWSHLEKAAYLMMSFFVWPTLPKFFFLCSNSNYSSLPVDQFFCIKFGDGESCGGGDMYSEGIKYLLRA